MFTVTPNGANRIDIELTGKLDAIAIKVGLDQLVSESKDIVDGKMRYQISDVDFPSLGAMGVELSRSEIVETSTAYAGLSQTKCRDT